MRITRIVTMALTALILSPAAIAQEMPQSGFMEDYSILQRVDDGSADYRYVSEGALERVAKYQAIMVDQPEIFVADDSPYKGAKPKHLASLADAFRAGIASAFAEDYFVVDKAGEDVMYTSVAISNLRLEKKKRRLIGYTPIGLVGGAVVGAAQSDIAQKADLSSAVIEFEVRDSVSGELIVAAIDIRGGEDAPATWEELEAAATAYGKIAACRLTNARTGSKVNCLEEIQRQRAN